MCPLCGKLGTQKDCNKNRGQFQALRHVCHFLFNIMEQMKEPSVLFGALLLNFEDGVYLESRGRCYDFLPSHHAGVSAGAVLFPRVCVGMSGVIWILTTWDLIGTGQVCCIPSYKALDSPHNKESSGPRCEGY